MTMKDGLDSFSSGYKHTGNKEDSTVTRDAKAESDHKEINCRGVFLFENPGKYLKREWDASPHQPIIHH